MVAISLAVSTLSAHAEGASGTPAEPRDLGVLVRDAVSAACAETGPSLTEDLLAKLQAGAKADAAEIKPLFHRLAALRARIETDRPARPQ